MTWFAPPELVKKPSANEWLRLPAQIKPSRLRWLLFMGAGFFSLLVATAAYITAVILEYFGFVSHEYQTLITVFGAIIGIIIGCVLIMKMVYLAIASSQKDDSSTRSI